MVDLLPTLLLCHLIGDLGADGAVCTGMCTVPNYSEKNVLQIRHHICFYGLEKYSDLPKLRDRVI